MPLVCFLCSKRAVTSETENGKLRSLHRLPINKPELLKMWLDNMKIKNNFQPTAAMRICSEHFSDDCIIVTKSNRKLKSHSIPTIDTEQLYQCSYCKMHNISSNPQTLHKFPRDNPPLRRRWLQMIKPYYPGIDVNDLLCSSHFLSSCFRKNRDGWRLKSNSVPSIFDIDQLQGTIRAVMNSTSGLVKETPSVRHQMSLMDSSTMDIAMQSDRNISTIIENGTNDIESVHECVIPSKRRKIIESSTNTTTLESAHRTTNRDFTQNFERTEASASVPKVTFDTSIVNQIRKTIKHDHHYLQSSRSLRARLCSILKAKQRLATRLQRSRTKIKRLENKVNNLQGIISDLHRKKSLIEQRFCIESI